MRATRTISTALLVVGAVSVLVASSCGGEEPSESLQTRAISTPNSSAIAPRSTPLSKVTPTPAPPSTAAPTLERLMIPSFEPMVDKRVTINGTALNAKSGAIVQTDSQHVVHIGRLQEWDDSTFGKLVRVTGIPTEQKLAPDPQVDNTGAVSAGMYGTAYVLQGATWTLINSIELGLSAQVGRWVLNANPDHIEPSEEPSGGHIVATYNSLGDSKKQGELVLTTYGSAENAREALETTVGKLNSDYVGQQIKGIGIEMLVWTRAELKPAGSGGGYYLLFGKQLGGKDENAAGAMWVSQNALWRLHVEPTEPRNEERLEELVGWIMAAVSKDLPP